MIIKSKNAKRELDMKQIVQIVIVVLGVLVFFWIFVSYIQCTDALPHTCTGLGLAVLVGIALVAVVVGYQTFRVITA